MSDNATPATAPAGGQIVLRSRQAPTSAVERTGGPSDALLERARMMAASTDFLPKAYANRPGACMMLLDWCNRYDVSIFDGVAEVAPIGGKPFVSARLQKRLARRAGYSTEVVESSASSATVEVFYNGEALGTTTYTIQMAEDYGLLQRSARSGVNGGTDFWKADAEWMLIKRATTRGLERWGPDDLATIFNDADEAPDVDPVPVAQPVAADEAPVAETPDLPDYVVDPAALKRELKDAGKTQGAALKAMQDTFPDAGLTSIDAVARETEAVKALRDWVDQG